MAAEAPSLDTIFCAAIEMASPEDRAIYIAEACGDNRELRSQVDKLIAAHFRAGNFLEAMTPLAETPADPVSELPGTIIGPYKLLEQIGEGGMGTVFMAEQIEPVHRKVALKIIKPGMDSRQVIGRFQAERQAMAMMDHPNIAKVFDAGTTDEDQPYFVMELVKGIPITFYCDEHNLLIRERLELFISVCHALTHAHQKGIIHRDLKPSNVLVARYDDQPVPKVIDFGVAKATGQKLTERTLFTHFGQLVGTLEYMSPEQATLNALDVDTRSDIYSLGVLLYELLTGSTPFEKKRLKETALDEVLRIIRMEEPPTPSTRLAQSKETVANIAGQRKTEPAKLTKLVRGDLDWIVMKALEKDRNRRYESAYALAADVELYLKDKAVSAGPPTSFYVLRKFAWRHRKVLGMATILIALICALGAIAVLALEREAREKNIAGQEQNRLAMITSQVKFAMNTARDLLNQNQSALAAKKLEEAKVLVEFDRDALGDVAKDVQSLDDEITRFRKFETFVEKSHEDEFFYERVTFLFKAFDLYEVMNRDDWFINAGMGSLGKMTIDRLRRTVYEELLWLAHDTAVIVYLDPKSRARFNDNSPKPLSYVEGAQCALPYLKLAEKSYPATQGLYRLSADCYQRLGREDLAVLYRQKAESRPPTLAIDFYQLARSSLKKADKTSAIKAFEEALRLEPSNFWALMYMGNCYVDLGQDRADYLAGLNALTGCIALRPNSVLAYYWRAIALERLERLSDSENDYTSAILLGERSSSGHFVHALNKRCLLRSMLGRRPAALMDLSKALTLDKSFMLSFRNVCEYMQPKNGLWPNMLAELEKAMAADPKNAFLPSILAYCLAVHPEVQERNPERAIELAKRSLALDPAMWDVGNLSALGIAYYSKGDWANAKIYLEKTVDRRRSLANDWPDSWFFLAMTYARLAQIKEARETYKQALKQMYQREPNNAELMRFRDEAAKLIGITDQPKDRK